MTGCKKQMAPLIYTFLSTIIHTYKYSYQHQVKMPIILFITTCQAPLIS